MSSASFDGWLRASNTSQPNTQIMIRYRRRKDTDPDLAPIRPPTPNRRSAPLRGYTPVSPPIAWTSRAIAGTVFPASEANMTIARRSRTADPRNLPDPNGLAPDPSRVSWGGACRVRIRAGVATRKLVKRLR
jgi:hypothetical protein